MYRLVNDTYELRNQEGSKNGNRFKVFGKGIVSIRPDAAEVVIGVITENIQLKAAQEENARRTRNVIESIKDVGVLAKYIQTQNYNIRPKYDYNNGIEIFRGYEVVNNLKVLITNIEIAGEIIDIAVGAGANNVSGISFTVTNIAQYYNEALSLAVSDAQGKALVIANKLKVKLDIVPIEINEQYRGEISPLYMTLKNSAGQTPIEAGENKITADIEAVFIYN